MLVSRATVFFFIFFNIWTSTLDKFIIDSAKKENKRTKVGSMGMFKIHAFKMFGPYRQLKMCFFLIKGNKIISLHLNLIK